MLHEFLSANREEIIDRCRAKASLRHPGNATDAERYGVPLFLDQLTEILRAHHSSGSEIGQSAAGHGAELLRQGFTFDEVVRDYGDVCQAVADMAVVLDAPITIEEFRTLNRCINDAIAGAVTEFGHLRDRILEDQETERTTERLGVLAHESRNLIHSAILSYEALKAGSVGIGGSTSAVLGRSLLGLRDLVERSLAEVRLTAGLVNRKKLLLAEFIEEVVEAATLDATAHNLELNVPKVDRQVVIEADRQILAAAVANLLQNAFKFTRPLGTISLMARATAERVLIEIQDQCGGLPPGKAELLFRPYQQRGLDRSGLGLGLAISQRSVEANGGTIQVRNLPGEGCIFTLVLPRQPSPGAAHLAG
jgi:signal transduction histidine kinase